MATDTQPNLSAIYLITCLVNGKQYVGQARNLRTRWRFHRSSALGKPSQSYSQKTAIARAMRKHGFDNFEIAILEVCEVDQLDEREIYWIATLRTLSPAGYNLTTGGTRPKRLAKEVGRRISAANKGHIKGPEWRAKLSKAHTGKKMSPEACRKISEVQRGRKHSEETKRKRSLALAGRKLGPYSPARCAAISAGMTAEGHTRSVAASITPEAVERRAQKLRGKKRTAEQRQRMAAGQRARWSHIPKEERAVRMLTITRKRKTWTPSEATKLKISATLKARNAAIREAAGSDNG